MYRPLKYVKYKTERDYVFACEKPAPGCAALHGDPFLNQPLIRGDKAEGSSRVNYRSAQWKFFSFFLFETGGKALASLSFFFFFQNLLLRHQTFIKMKVRAAEMSQVLKGN